jgi:DNA-binding MarR family transcriptional regulator
MTHRLDRLEQRGLVSRTPSPKDRRQVMVSLTAAGHTLADQTVSIRATDAHNLVSLFNDTDRERLEELLRELLLTFEEQLG